MGTIVVGMDTRTKTKGGHYDLEPAVGATAHMKGISGDPPYILYDGFIPREGQAVIPRGSSFVTWTNVEPDVTGAVEVSPPEGMKCVVSPGVSSVVETFRFPVYSDAVTVISYICVNLTVSD